MAELTVELCGHRTTIACAPEDEARVRHLVTLVAERTEAARAIVGEGDRWRQLLFAAIFLADELDGDGQADQDRAITPTAGVDNAVVQRLDMATQRLAAALERIECAVNRP